MGSDKPERDDLLVRLDRDHGMLSELRTEAAARIRELESMVGTLAALQQDESELAHKFGDRLEKAKARIAELEAEVERLRAAFSKITEATWTSDIGAIVELSKAWSKLPVTADGVYKACDTTEDMLVYSPTGVAGVIGLHIETGWTVWPAGDACGEKWPLPVSQCYSTLHAAEAARGGEG